MTSKLHRAVAPVALRVGASQLLGSIERYAQRLNLLELAAEASLPPPRSLRRLKETAPPGFVFSVALGRAAALVNGSPEAEAAVTFALAAQSALAAGWLVARTPASVMPSERHRRRLIALFQKLQATGARVAWEPRGVWEADEAEAFAAESGVVLVRDLVQSDAPDGPVVYSRLLLLGVQSRIGQGAIERIAERLEAAEEALVVVDGRGAPGVAGRLRRELGLEAGESGDDLDGDEEDEDEDGEDEGEDEDGEDENDDE